ncbi:hypothetical protein G5714_022683 [Onychostoma macrolepis]|uniref:Uncharacterized protein n=1 Tax=Onychostoma macrolepis TaxID=369639 RepID=A0A7J6BNZ1_9TELE|nr:hypothetical protein G5714_022683 [Onychostoma macrolepis]
MRGVIYHCQIHCLTSLAETAVSLGAHQRGVGGRSLLLSQKAYCRTHLMFLTPILPSPLTLPPPFSPEMSFELQIERRTERESGFPAVSCSTVPAVLPRRGSSCSSKKDRQLHGHVDDVRKKRRKQVNGGMLQEFFAAEALEQRALCRATRTCLDLYRLVRRELRLVVSTISAGISPLWKIPDFTSANRSSDDMTPETKEMCPDVLEKMRDPVSAVRKPLNYRHLLESESRTKAYSFRGNLPLSLAVIQLLWTFHEQSIKVSRAHQQEMAESYTGSLYSHRQLIVMEGKRASEG